MSKRGVTPEGFVKKRLDEVISEVQKDLTEGFGFDVALNPQSSLNVLITNFSDRISQLWEVAEDTYFSHYPSTAEGVSLDNAGQFGGLTREGDKRTAYTILCTGKDGTPIGEGTRIASNTLPKIYFVAMQDFEINRNAFNKVRVKVVSAAENETYSVTIDGNAYTYFKGDVTPTSAEIVEALRSEIEAGAEGFTATVEDEVLVISCDSERKSNVLVLSENLTTETVSCLFTFHSEEYGKVVLPEGAISEIVTTVVGFDSCSNLGSPSYGRLRETDIEYRQSYLKKIASRSTMMLESVVAAILENVENVQSASAYENDSGETDAEGRPPHSIEVVVDGGSEVDIAAEILKNKAAGIASHGEVEVEVPDVFGSVIKVRFNRPQNVYVWLKVHISKNPKQAMPPNYADLIKDAIVMSAMELNAGDAVITQDFFGEIKAKCTGIAYMDISAYHNADSDAAPADAEYTEKFVEVTSRQKPVITADRIEVVLDGA